MLRFWAHWMLWFQVKHAFCPVLKHSNHVPCCGISWKASGRDAESFPLIIGKEHVCKSIHTAACLGGGQKPPRKCASVHKQNSAVSQWIKNRQFKLPSSKQSAIPRRRVLQTSMVHTLIRAIGGCTVDQLSGEIIIDWVPWLICTNGFRAERNVQVDRFWINEVLLYRLTSH